MREEKRKPYHFYNRIEQLYSGDIHDEGNTSGFYEVDEHLFNLKGYDINTGLFIIDFLIWDALQFMDLDRKTSQRMALVQEMMKEGIYETC